jgi:hypothetical protein
LILISPATRGQGALAACIAGGCLSAAGTATIRQDGHCERSAAVFLILFSVYCILFSFSLFCRRGRLFFIARAPAAFSEGGEHTGKWEQICLCRKNIKLFFGLYYSLQYC